MAAAGKRLGTTTIDQALAGGSNVLIALLAAQSLGVASFGFFSIVFLVYVTAQGANRALVGEPLLIRPVEAQERPGEAIGTSLVTGSVLGVLVVLAGLGARFADTELGNGLVVLGLLFPLLALQDLGRYLGFATQRPSLALRLDLTWFLLQLVTVAVVLVADLRTLPWFIAAWAGAGAVAGLLVLRQHGGDAVRWGRAWLAETWGFSWRYLSSFALTQGGALGSTIALSVIAGSAALGGVRGALLLMSPALTFQIAASAWGIASISRANGSADVLRLARVVTAVAAGVSVLNGVVVFLPDAIGEAVLSDSWEASEPLLALAWAQTVLIGVVLGARCGLLGSRAVATNLRLDVLFMPVIVVLAVVGSLLDDGMGYYWGAVLGQALAVPLWWGVLSRRLRTGPALVSSEEVHP